MKLCFFLPFLAFSNWLLGQIPPKQLPNTLTFQCYTNNQGLSNNYVVEVVEDKHHFIWAMTLDGINRLDGAHIRQYTLEDTSKVVGLPCLRLLVDYKGDVWAINNTNLFKYNPAKDTFELKISSAYDTFTNANKKLLPQFAILNDTTGHCFWIVKEKKLLRYAIERNQIEETSIEALHNPFLALKINPTTLLIVTEKEWVCYDTETKKMSRETHSSVDWTVLNYQTNQWIYTDNSKSGIWKMNFENGKFSRPILLSAFQEEARCLATFSMYGENLLWLGLVGRGLWLKDLSKKNNYEKLCSQLNETNGFYYLTVRHLFQDSQHNIWIATSQGLYRTNPTSFQIHKEIYPFFRERKINRVKQVVQHPINKEAQWIATAQHGVYLYDNRRKKVIKVIKTKGGRVNQMRYDKQNNLWILGEGVITKIGIKGERTTVVLAASKPDMVSLKMVFDADDNLWIATEIGLIKLINKTTQKKLFAPANGDLSHAKVYDLAFLKDSTIALATPNGLHIFDPKTSSVVLKVGEGKNWVSVVQDTKGTVWATSLDKLYKIKNGKMVSSWSHYGNNKKIFLKALYIGQQANCIWGNDNSGLVRFDLQTEKFQLFTDKDDLLDTYFYGFIYENNGYLCLNYEEGINYFDPNQLQREYKSNSTIITDFSLSNKRQDVATEGNTGPFKVKYDQNMIVLKYTLVDFERPDRLFFRVKLEGFDDDWINVGPRREANYTNLSGGKYTFKVQALNGEGSFFGNAAHFTFYVTTPFYRSWWFLILLFFAIALLLYGLYRYRLAQILRFYTLRNRISRDLHDEVGSTLSSIAMLSASARNAMDTDQNRSKMLIESISANTQKTMESMDDIVWTINPREDSLESILLRMSQYAYSVTESKNIKLHIEENAAISKVKIQMQKRRNLYLIFKEAVINAAKHSACTAMNIEFRVVNNSLEMRVIDNGQGFDTTITTYRNGLRNMQQRAKEINGILVIESIQGRGTTLSLTIKK